MGEALRPMRRMAGLADRLRPLLHLDDEPWRIALSLAVGVFISFTPLWGLQTVLSVLVAAVVGLNKVAILAGTWINLPWFAPFVYAGALKLGGVLVPQLTGLGGMSAALLIGTTILGVGAGAVTYVVALSVLRRRRVPPPEHGDGESAPRAA
jgi:uncharacterized protein (DUF2062 family)